MSLHNQTLPETEISNRLSFWHLFMGVICTLILFSCNNSPKSETRPVVKRDTTRQLALFPSPDGKRIIHDVIGLVSFDTLAYFPLDEKTQVKRWGRDSIVHVFIVDTLRDGNGKPKLDSLGKVQFQSTDWIYPKDRILLWGQISFDSAMKKYNLLK